MSERTKVVVALISGVLGLVLFAGAVIALVLGISARGRMPAAENPYAPAARVAIALGIVGIITSGTLTVWLLS